MSSNPAQINSRNESLGNATSVTAPAQFTVMANVTIPAAGKGYYRIKAQYGYGGTAETATQDNFTLVKNNTSLTTLIATVSQTNTLFPIVEFWINLDAGDVVKIITANNASASSVYKTSLLLDKMNP